MNPKIQILNLPIELLLKINEELESKERIDRYIKAIIHMEMKWKPIIHMPIREQWKIIKSHQLKSQYHRIHTVLFT